MNNRGSIPSEIKYNYGRTCKPPAGVTLVEIMIVSVVLVVLMGILTAALTEARFIFLVTDITVNLQSRARIAIENMLSDLRRATNSTSSPYGIAITLDSPAGSDSDSIQYQLPAWAGGSVVWGLPVTISLDTDTNELIRDDGLSQTVLARGVKRINFIDQTVDVSLYMNELKIILELEKTDDRGRPYNMVYISTVNMRN